MTPEAEALVERLNGQTFVSSVINALANIVRLATLEKRGIHEDYIKREPVMMAVLTIRNAVYELGRALTEAKAKLAQAEKDRDECASFIRTLNEEFQLRGYPGGDRTVVLTNLRAALSAQHAEEE